MHNMRPVGQIWTAKAFYSARKAQILRTFSFIFFIENLYKWVKTYQNWAL